MTRPPSTLPVGPDPGRAPDRAANKAVSPRFAAFQPGALEFGAASAPVRLRLALYLLLGLVVFALVFACLARVDRIVAAPGKLVSSQNNLAIQPLETSVIREVMVSVGERVQKGQAPVALDPTFAEADLGELEKKRQGLAAKVWRLTSETSGASPPSTGIAAEELALERDILEKRRQERVAKVEALDRRVRECAAKLQTNGAAKIQARKQIGLARDLVAMYREIFAKGASSKIELMKAESSRNEAEGQLAKLDNEARELDEARARAVAEEEDFESNWRAEAAKDLADASRNLAEVEERTRKATRRSELVVLRAPEAGVVLDVPSRSAGAVVPQGETILTLVPQGEELLAEADVAAQDIGLVRPGDTVRLKFEAFPFQRHGVATGVLRNLSPDAFETKTPEGQRLVYRARVAITDLGLRNVPADVRLIAGMSLTCEIKVGTRRVISYLLYPLIRSFDESLREP